MRSCTEPVTSWRVANDSFAVAPDAGQPAGHAHHVAGADVGIQPVVALMQLGRGGRPVEAERIGVDPLGRQDLPLLAPVGAQ